MAQLAGKRALVNGASQGIGLACAQLFARAGVQRSIGIEVPDGSIHMALVRAGLGVAIIPRAMIEDAGLVGVPLRPAATFNIAYIVPDRPLSPVTQAFTDLVAATNHLVTPANQQSGPDGGPPPDSPDD